MQSVSAAFIAALQETSPDVRVYVDYKKRYWGIADQAFIEEASWTTLDNDDILDAGKLTYELDIKRSGDYRIPNMTLKLKNDMNQWKSDNDIGKFKPTTVVPAGFIHYLTKFRVRVGVVLASGSEEVISYFTGIATSWTPNIRERFMQVRIDGLEHKLVLSDAENVSTEFTESKTSTGQTEFSTTTKQVSKILDNALQDGDYVKQGVDYSVTDLNLYDTVAKLTFATSVPNGEVVSYEGRSWHTSKKIEELIVLLLQEAGFASDEYVVNPVLFPSAVNNVWTQETQADWDAGTDTNVSTTDYPNTVCLLDTPVNPLSNPSFETQGSGDATTAAYWTQPYLYMGLCRRTNGAGLGAPDLPAQNGTWFLYSTVTLPYNTDFKLQLLNATTDQVLITWDLLAGIPSAYWTLYTLSGLLPYKDILCKLRITVNGWASAISTESFYVANTNTLQIYSYRNSTLLCCDNITGNIKRVFAASGNIVTQTLDGTASLTAWGRLSYDATVPDGTTVVVETASSANGSDWDDYVALGVGGAILSATKRYLRVRASMTTSNTGITPTLSRIQVQYTTSSTTISVGNFAGMTCFSAISELARLPLYDIGFDGDGVFFFRSRDTNTAIDQVITTDMIESLDSYSDGIENVYNQIEISFGTHTKTINSELNGDSHPNSDDKYGNRKLPISAGQQLMNADADVASGAAQTLYRILSRPRKVIKFTCKTPLLHMERGDVVKVTYEDISVRFPYLNWFWGDSQRSYLLKTLDTVTCHWISKKQFIVKDLVSRVVGVEFNIKSMKYQMTVEEIV